MFSQASVSHSVHNGEELGWESFVACFFQGIVYLHMPRGWVLTLPIHGPGILRDMVDKRAVRILLDYFLV